MSPNEKKFTFLWLHVVKGTTDLICEHKFHPSRKWRFDFAHPTTGSAARSSSKSARSSSRAGWCRPFGWCSKTGSLLPGRSEHRLSPHPHPHPHRLNRNRTTCRSKP
jgi:hypothetical protein